MNENEVETHELYFGILLSNIHMAKNAYRIQYSVIINL